MDPIIITEDFIDGILWVMLVGGGMLLLFVLIALVMLCRYNPKCSPYMKEEGKP